MHTVKVELSVTSVNPPAVLIFYFLAIDCTILDHILLFDLAALMSIRIVLVLGFDLTILIHRAIFSFEGLARCLGL